jgi:hypothetical protein
VHHVEPKKKNSHYTSCSIYVVPLLRRGRWKRLALVKRMPLLDAFGCLHVRRENPDEVADLDAAACGDRVTVPLLALAFLIPVGAWRQRAWRSLDIVCGQSIMFRTEEGRKTMAGWLHVTGRRFLFFKHSKYSLYYLFSLLTFFHDWIFILFKILF